MFMHRVAAAIRAIGVASFAIGTIFTVLVAAHPLGLVDAYPMPPDADLDGPFGARTKIESLDSLYRKAEEPLHTYFPRLVKEVSEGFVHYWHKGEKWAPQDSEYTRPSMWDNYLLWLHPLIPEYEHFNRYEFISPKKALDRGYGFCSQVSRLVWSILRDQGIRAEILIHPNHVVVQSNGYILDADYGVTIPNTALEIMNSDPAGIIAEYYARFDWMLPTLTQIYSEGWKSSGFEDPSMVYMLRYEAKMDALKWLPPVALLLGGLMMWAGASVFLRRELRNGLVRT